jgi:hypothetical protein
MGAGQLMRTAVEKAKPVHPDVKLDICGEHGSDPESVKFCHRIGLNYVSCSPFRVPPLPASAYGVVIGSTRLMLVRGLHPRTPSSWSEAKDLAPVRGHRDAEFAPQQNHSLCYVQDDRV